MSFPCLEVGAGTGTAQIPNLAYRPACMLDGLFDANPAPFIRPTLFEYQFHNYALPPFPDYPARLVGRAQVILERPPNSMAFGPPTKTAGGLKREAEGELLPPQPSVRQRVGSNKSSTSHL